MTSSEQGNFGRLLKLALTYDSNPSKEEFFDIVHWLRQIIALVLGVVAGYLHLTGFPIIAAFFIINFGFFHIYATKYLNFEDEKTEQHELYTEGLMIGFFTFVLTWIVTHTFV